VVVINKGEKMSKADQISKIQDKILWLELEVKVEQNLLDEWNKAGGKVDWNAGVQIARITRSLKEATRKLEFQTRKLNKLNKEEIC
jgi:hypothetical protein